METPEWEFFTRLEQLEKLEPKIQELRELRPILADAYRLSVLAFAFAFSSAASKHSNPRKLKDGWLAYLRKRGFSTETLEAVESWLTTVCELYEE